MYKLKINGDIHNVEQDGSLMRYLRDVLKLKSVKDGCSEGACGTCSILVDGKVVKSCIRKISKMEDKEIVTIEGFTEEERQVYTYAFSICGAVQCGFCIPGMVICAKSLLDVNQHPTRQEAAFAIRNNICRCTGYKKIIDAIIMAGKIFAGELEMEDFDKDIGIGRAIKRIEVHEKVVGTAMFTDDYEEEDMLYSSCLRSKYPRAIIKSLDFSKAEALDGIVKVFTAADIPEGGSNIVGHLVQDWNTYIEVGDTTRYIGDALCNVVGESEEIVAEAKKLIEVEYEVLTPITSPQQGLAEDAPKIHAKGNLLSHEHLLRGDSEKAIKEAAHVVTHHFETPFTDHAFLEPETSVAKPYKEGVLVYSSDQSVFDTQHELIALLGLPAEQVVVENFYVGGGFGGKEDVSVQHHAALAAYVLKRTVKCKLTRQESLNVHPKRHAASMEMTIACDEKGKFTGMKAELLFDTGAYASLGGPVLQRACTHAAGPYNYQNIDIDGKAVYTNNPPGGAFRGFGVTQSCYAIEACINELAKEAGLTPYEIRYINAIRPGNILPNGQIAGPETGLAETLEAVKDIYEENINKAGIACALKNSGLGVGVPDVGRCKLRVEDGKLNMYSSSSCMGQGLATAFLQILSETVDIAVEDLVYHRPNTEITPNSGVSSASRQTTISGEAVRRAGEKFKQAIDAGKTIADLEGEEFYAEFVAETDPMGSDKPNPVSHVGYGYATQVCILNEEDKTVDKVVAAHDVGKAINPLNLEGQIEGGVVMSLGYALTEDFLLDGGYVKSKYGTLGLLKANKVPEIESILIEKDGLGYAYGAVGIGEITSIPTAPAVQGAYYALDNDFRCDLPLRDTPYSKKKK